MESTIKDIAICGTRAEVQISDFKHRHYSQTNLEAKKKQFGFTLIETMLVIAVVAIVMLFMVDQSRARRQEGSINRTVEELQQWVTASSSYFMREGRRWPKSVQDVLDREYMPYNSQCSGWPVLNPTDPDCGGHSDYQIYLPGNNDRATVLTVSVAVPTEELAKEISSRLPHSYTKQDKVSLIIPIPTRVAATRQGLLIKEIKQQYYGSDKIVGSEKIFFPLNSGAKRIECPSTWKRNYRAGLARFANCWGLSSLLGVSCQWSIIGATTPVRRTLVAIPAVDGSRDTPPAKDKDWKNAAPLKDWAMSIRMQTDTTLSFLPLVGYPDIFYGDATAIEYCVPPDYKESPL